MKDTAAVSALAALAHADRLRAFRLLVKAGPSGLPSGEIAERLSIMPTRMSFHLAGLDRSGLVHSWREGRQVRYAVRFEAMRALMGFLAQDCCDGNPEICGVVTDPCKEPCVPADGRSRQAATGPVGR
ncbi:ArsR/SmtB family transcription factor [Jiella mangrovi]|uniref:Helix-turn-helix transcriptional regulator n=1 Tax=Jiella mangrovi TaxID=2821407 RepID=A0ABS4BH48_9HYPH|nr:helix-turn-helix transcriptional regulator [Jiella mangrovi]MBP0616021.1 helix-turn-helix transcriptional regulator [Jiella mangrovi]